MYDLYYDPYTELYHHGIKGQKWGVRRYQNSDGSLTEAGKRHYGKNSKKYGFVENYKHQNAYNKMKRGVEKGKLTRKQMNRGLKELGMSKAEIDFRDAYRDYSKMYGNYAMVGTFLTGPVGGMLVGSIAMNATSAGRQYINRLNTTGEAYQQEKLAYKNRR